MNSIFWTQNESNKEPDTLIIDGNVYKDRSLPSEVQAKFDFIMDYLKRNRLYRESYVEIQKTYNLSRNFIISKRVHDFFLQSTFLEKDIEGRNMAFAFWCNGDDIDLIIKSLENCARIANRTLKGPEIEVLPKLCKKTEVKNNKILISVILFIIVSLTILYFLWN